jgi:hypothetical protein
MAQPFLNRGDEQKHSRACFLTEMPLPAYKQPKLTALFSRVFLSFSTPQCLEKRLWTRLLAYTGTVNSFPFMRSRRNPGPVTESVDKFFSTARIRKVFRQ